MAEVVISYEQVGDCWNALKPLSSNGFPIVQINRRTRLVHRMVYEQFVAPIPAGKRVKRSCSNSMCCRPDHLYIKAEAQRKPISEDRRYGKRELCKRGHELSDDNVYYLKSGGRYCKECVAIRGRKKYGHNVKIETNE